jgi:predicted lipid-binding transport protein (Tim44 family)
MDLQHLSGSTRRFEIFAAVVPQTEVQTLADRRLLDHVGVAFELIADCGSNEIAHPVTGHSFGGLSGMLGGANVPPTGDPLTIAKSDYDAFERLLGDIQAAYSTEDLSVLRAQVTPEMLSYFSEELAGNASRGLINRVTDVKLLRGDLAEAWREGNTDYATVAMNFALKDSMVERVSGQTVEGGERSEVTELWTFMRARGGNWLLSAIQQT